MGRLKLILFSAIVVLTMGLGATIIQLKSTTAERDRIKNNYEQVSFELNKSLSMTKRELNAYISRNKVLDSLLQAEKIKPARIEYITEVKHSYRVDTVWVEVGEWVVPGEVFPISYKDKCLSFGGSVDISGEKPEVGLFNIEYSDNQTHVGYLKKRDTGRRVLWVFPVRKRFLELHTHSDCGDNEVHHIEILK